MRNDSFVPAFCFIFSNNTLFVIYSDHNDIKNDIMMKHEAKLDELENYCHNSSDEYDDKLNRTNQDIEERKVYLLRAQELLQRYK